MTTTARVHRAGALDALSAGTVVWVVVGPLRRASTDAVVPTLQRIVDDGGASNRIGLWPDAATLRWRFDADLGTEYTIDEVSVDADDPARTLAALMALSNPETGSRAPIRARVDNDYLAIGFDHGLGDGVVMMETVAALSDTGISETGTSARGFAPPAPQPNIDFPLPAAVAATVRKHPAEALTYLGELATQAGGFAVRRLPRRRPVQDRSEPAERRVDTVDHRPHPTATPDQAPAYAVAWQRSSNTFRAELNEWRSEHAPGTSLSTILVHSLYEAMRRNGIRLSDEVDLLVDLRRHLPDGASTLASVSTVVTIDTAELAPGVEAFGAAVKAELESSRPLLRAAVAAMVRKARLSSRLRGFHERADGDDAARLIISDMTRLSGLERTSWAQPTDNPVFGVAMPPAGRNRISVAINRIGPTMFMTATYAPDVVDGEALQEALAAALNTTAVQVGDLG